MEKTLETLAELNKGIADYAVPYQWYDAQSETDARTQFEHDQSVIIYSNAFRRMSNKSQIIVKPLRDHFRSRMVHTFEVKEIALAIGKTLDLNTELISAIALGHDLGHAPFGHAGERALQKIARREANGYVGLTIHEPEERCCFNHASNSARILAFCLDRSTNDIDITAETITGALKHSWNPWRGSVFKSRASLPADRPDTYEGQVVAIADQLAGINHDTEDILEAEEYVRYDVKRFQEALRGLVMSKIRPKHRRKALEPVISQSVTTDARGGYGRKFRIENAITELTRGARRFFAQEKPLRVEATTKPIPFPEELGELLDVHEELIRMILRRETWFIGRDTMADAMITTVFNHFWPVIKGWSFDPGSEREARQLRLPLEKERVKAGKPVHSTYLDHFSDYCESSYIGTEERPYDLDGEVARTKDLGIETWVSYLYNLCDEKAGSSAEFEKMKQKLVRLVALIDFIAGLTDRYCLEIFQTTYRDFMVQG